jgi:hypothetical protein
MKEMIKTASDNKIFNTILMLILIAAIAVVIFIRIRFLPTPLERDEGEYAYAGQLMLQGVPPYQLAYNMKMPGIYAAYALILAIFGQTQSGIHFGIIIINTATIVLIFLLTKKLFGNIAALAAGAFFAITSLSNTLQLTANAENFVLLFAIPAILLLWKYQENKKIIMLISSGLLLGTAFMMKQHAFAFILFGYMFLLCQKPFNLKKIASSIIIFSFCAVLPFLITSLLLWHYGVFDKFWFWCFKYARQYVALVSWQTGYSNLKEILGPIIFSALFVWLFALLGVISLLSEKFRQNRVFVLTLFICSIISVCPGLYFRPHYFALLLPVVCMLAGAGIVSVQFFLSNLMKSDFKAALIAVVIIIAAWSQSFYSQRNYLLETDPVRLSRYNFGVFPFPETLEVANFIKSRPHSKDDKIAVFGSEPQIYFYSQMRSATSFIYTYPLVENQPFAMQMQQEMIEQIQTNKPKFIVVAKTRDSWMLKPGCVTLIFQWAETYFHEHYRQIGLVEIFKEQGEVVYHWDSDVSPQKPESWIMILERIN